jgi:hypothetical protein
MAISFDLELPAGEELPAIARADLTFYGLDHSGPSYEVRVFFDKPDANADTPLDDPSHAGSFSVFGHGGCFGDEGHCEVTRPVSAFDRRLPYQLAPATRVLICTAAVRQLVATGRGQATVTLVEVVRAAPLVDPDAAREVLRVDQVALHTYE